MSAKMCKCPKCGRMLRASGEVALAGLVVPTFQCEECLRVVDFMGERLEVALTFVVGTDGRPFDPAEPGADLAG